jgi:predicted HAD superfamily Cof-like phosphohydrolase
MNSKRRRQLRAREALEKQENEGEEVKEENEEYLAAANAGDLVEIADALGDMLYILAGTIIEHGMQDKIAEVFDEIQRSNMSKLGDDGNPIFRNDGKVLNRPNYSKPDIQRILNDSIF